VPALRAPWGSVCPRKYAPQRCVPAQICPAKFFASKKSRKKKVEKKRSKKSWKISRKKVDFFSSFFEFFIIFDPKSTFSPRNTRLTCRIEFVAEFASRNDTTISVRTFLFNFVSQKAWIFMLFHAKVMIFDLNWFEIIICEFYTPWHRFYQLCRWVCLKKRAQDQRRNICIQLRQAKSMNFQYLLELHWNHSKKHVFVHVCLSKKRNAKTKKNLEIWVSDVFEPSFSRISARNHL